MKPFLLPLLVILLAGPAGAQVNPLDSIFVQSISGQFTVVEPRTPPRPEPLPSPFRPPATNKTDSVVVDADRLAVACERIREALNNELGASGPWQGKIHIFLHPESVPDTSITLASERFPDGWSYRLDVPDHVGRVALVRAIVTSLLLEQANRQADSHSAEIPVWLSEGLTQQLRAGATVDVIPPTPLPGFNGISTAPVSVNRRLKDPLDGALTELRAHPPLTLKQLSWPDEQSLDGNAGAAYRCNAQLFVDELIELPDGRASLRNMLAALPNYYNWQTAFYGAFGHDFPSQLDLEKWWALQVVHFTGPGPTQRWSSAEGWQKLDEIVHTTVDIRETKSALPAQREANLQDLIQNFDYAHQRPLLMEKLQELELARVYSVPEQARLAGEYRDALTDYVKACDQMGGASYGSKGLNSTKGIMVDNVLRTLDKLEVRRAALRPQPDTTNTAQAGF